MKDEWEEWETGGREGGREKTKKGDERAETAMGYMLTI